MFLLSTGCRRGEALTLKWGDVDFAGNRIWIRRSLVRGRLGTPKDGKARAVVLSPALADTLRRLRSQTLKNAAERAIESDGDSEPQVPEFIFVSRTGGFLDERNVTRSWHRVRREAERHGVRPLRLHDARHTFASLALAAGKSVRWVASQLGHANPELTLRVYAHALREEETDLGFLDFGGTKRHPRGTKQRAVATSRKPPRIIPRRGLRNLERETGIEPATLSLGKRKGRQK
jgi:integrase